MIVIAVTHAEANDPKKASFRTLTDDGVKHVAEAAGQLLSDIEKAAPKLKTGEVSIDRIVSSPHARCVQTAVLLADKIRQYISTDQILLSDKLTFEKMKEFDHESFVKFLNGGASKATLLCAHANLLQALPDQAKNSEFNGRPALVVLDSEQGGPGVTTMKFCRVRRSDGTWAKCLTESA